MYSSETPSLMPMKKKKPFEMKLKKYTVSGTRRSIRIRNALIRKRCVSEMNVMERMKECVGMAWACGKKGGAKVNY